MPSLDPVPQPLALGEPVARIPQQRLACDPPYESPAVDADLHEPPGLSAAPTASDLLHAFQRRWVLALTLACLGAGLGIVAVVQLFPARYTVQVRFEVPVRSGGPVLFPGSGDEDFAHFKNKVASLLKSPLVISAALKDEPIRNMTIVREHGDVAEWLETALKTDYFLGPEVLRASLSGEQPEELAGLLNAVAAAFVTELTQRERNRRLTLLEELKTNQRLEEEKLRQKQVTLRELEERRGLEDLETARMKFQAALSELATVRKARVDKRQDQINTQEEIHALQEREKGVAQAPLPPEQFEDILDRDLRVQAVLQEKGKVQKEIVDIQRVAPGSKQLIGQKQEILEGMDRELQRLKEKLRENLDRDLRGRLLSELKASAANLQDRHKMLKTQEAELNNEIRRMEEAAQKLNPANRPRNAEMLALENQVAYTQAALQELGKKIAMLTVEPAAGTRVTLVQKAEIPHRKDSSRQTKLAGTAGISLFSLLLLGVSFWEFRARKISQTDEVVRGLGLSLVGTLPSVPVRRRGPLIKGSGHKALFWQSQLSEAVDAIRTRLLHTSRGRGLKIVMVTSAVGGEGKTALASHLAASLARAGKNTLLVDGDLRHPAIHQVLDVPLKPGLSEVLRGEIASTGAVHPTLLNRLWTMPAGQWDSQAVQALAQDAVRPLFSQLKEQYDFVIVDSCPVLPVADALLLGQHVDAVLFAILRDVSRMPTVYAAQQCLHQLGIPLLGAVVVGARRNPASAYMTYA